MKKQTVLVLVTGLILVCGLILITGCPADAAADTSRGNPDTPVNPNAPSDPVDSAFWFGEIHKQLIERVGEQASEVYAGETGEEPGQIANSKYAIYL